MSETGGHPAAVREYERVLREVAERRAVDEAEGVLARAWIAELDEMRRTALGLVAAARPTSGESGTEPRDAHFHGRPAELARANAHLEAAAAEQRISLEQARSILASVDAEIEMVCEAVVERTRRSQDDLYRLQAAWAAAFTHSIGEQSE